MKVAILAGGSGTRLWPLSREEYPKQFIKINSEHSFFQKTVLRILKKFKPEDILISSYRGYKFHIISDLAEVISKSIIDRKLPHLIFESETKNTFGALLMVLNFSLNKFRAKENEVLLVLPSDHLIEPEEKFFSYLNLASLCASRNKIVVFGIEPQSEATGYGYIKAGEKIPLNFSGEEKVFKVEKFIEKPGINVVKRLLEQGSCFWNAGIFCFKIKTILEEIERFYPQTIEILKSSPEEFQSRFSKLPKISIDNAIMERTDRAVLLPLKDLSWSDIGSFDSLYEVSKKDENGNVKIGNVVVKDVKSSFLLSNKRLVSAVGIKNLLVVETEDALLIIPKSKSQKVKELVQDLKSSHKREISEHLTHYRPWGSFTILEEGPRYKIKHVMVNPGASLSLQLHHHRSEHWIVIRGVAKVRIDKMEKFIHENESAYVPRATVHRLENPGGLNLELIEVQNGEYLGEDDIQRFEDKYTELR